MVVGWRRYDETAICELSWERSVALRSDIIRHLFNESRPLPMTLKRQFNRAVLRDILAQQRFALRYALERPKSESARRHRRHEGNQRPIRMNLFPQLNILFVHIPKTAGTSVHSVLSGIDDSVGLAGGSVELLSGKSQPHKHSKASDWKALLGNETWDRLTTFTLVRNPWALMVSSYFWWIQKASKWPALLEDCIRVKEMGSFEKFMDSHYGRFYINQCPGTMSEWFQADGHDLVSHVGRVENLEGDIRTVLELSHREVPDLGIPHDNQTSHGGYQQYYSSSSREIVRKRFRDVIDRFEYRF